MLGIIIKSIVFEENVRKTPVKERVGLKTRDMQSSRQRFPRAAKNNPKPELERYQLEGYIFHNRDEETSDSEDENKKSSGPKE